MTFLFVLAIFPLGASLLVGGTLLISSYRRSGVYMTDEEVGIKGVPSLAAIGVGAAEIALGALMVAVGFAGPLEGSRVLEVFFINPIYPLIATAPLAYISFLGAIAGANQEGSSARVLMSQGERDIDSNKKKALWRSSLRPGGGIFLAVNGVCVSLSGLWLIAMVLIGLKD